MEYFVFEYGRQEGPFTLTQLMERGLRPETLVLSMDQNKWTPAWQVDELRALLEGDRTVREVSDCDGSGKKKTGDEGCADVHDSDVVSSGSVDSSPTSVDGENIMDTGGMYTSSCGAGERSYAQPVRIRHLGCIVLAAFIAGIAMLLAVTNPTRQQHVEAVKEQLVKAVSSSMGIDDGVLGMFNMGSFGMSGIVDVVAGQVLSVDSYGLFSVGHIRFGKYDKVVSFGMLGHVFTFDSKDIEKKMNNGDGPDAGKGNIGNDDKGGASSDGSGFDGGGEDKDEENGIGGDGDDGDDTFPTESV